MADIRLHHAERVPTEGAFIVAPNHVTEIDPVITAVAVYRAGRVPHFMAKASLFRVPVFGTILRRTDQIPVDRAGVARGSDAMQAARRTLDRGHCVMIYPEGTLTRDPDLWPMRGKSGAVRLALQAGVPLIPMAHLGAERLMPRYEQGIRPFPRKRIDVLFGEPIDLSPYGGGPTREGSVPHRSQADLNRATDDLMGSIASLLGELRQETPPAERWNPARDGRSGDATEAGTDG
jgi:1-acyl-sn-glycerol-3-phosphate acyltransferase